MKKISILFVFAAFLAGSGRAQGHAAGLAADSLGIGVYKGVKVVLHKVTPKETFYSIARHYNVHPKYLIQFNSDVQGLKIGDTIRLEVDSMNTFQNLVLVPENDEPAGEDLSPAPQEPPVSTVTEHVVAPRETLFSIARKYGLTVAQLSTLNSITESHIETGQRLIVSASGPIADDPEQLSAAASKPPATLPQTAEKPAAAEESGTAGEPEKKEKVSARTPSPIMGTPDQMAERERKKRNKLPRLVREVRESGVAAWLTNSSLNQAKSVALHKTAPSGTIIKVTNPANKKSIMVKVVGSFPENAETENALIVISQAASRLLGIQDNRFRVNLSYAIQE